MAWNRRDWFGLAGFLIVVATVATLSSLATIRAAAIYGELESPAWGPPSWLFGPVWTTLYAMMAVAGWRVWRTGAGWDSPALRWFGIQLVLNGFWSPIFFALELRFVALVVILMLVGAVVQTIRSFAPIDRASAWLLAPYLAWISFATLLNAAMWWLNR